MEATGRKIIVAGLWTEACVLLPSLDMLKISCEGYIPADTCRDISLEAPECSLQHLIQAGATPITSLQFIFELQQD